MTFGETSNEFYVLKHNGKNTKKVYVSYYVRNEKTAKKSVKNSYAYEDAAENSHANSITYRNGKLCVATCGDYVTRIDVTEEKYRRADYTVVDSNYKKLDKVPGENVNIKVGAITYFENNLYLVRFDKLRFALGKFEVKNGKKVFKIVSSFVKLDSKLGISANGYQDITYDSDQGFLYVASFDKDGKKKNTILKLEVTYKDNVLGISCESKFALIYAKEDKKVELFEVEGLCIQPTSKMLFFCTNEDGVNSVQTQAKDSIYRYEGER